MAQGSKIEWTDATWNPVTGCNKVSPGCKHCYAERLSKRLKATGMAKYSNGFEVTLHPDTLEIPLRWRKPRSIFVNSMSDLFHVDVPESFIRDVFGVMERADWHRYQVLTKRAERVAELSDGLPWPSQVWMGVSVESKDYAYRIDRLRETDAQVKFLSLEPLLGPLPHLNLEGIDWVIVGGESGPGARPMQPDWAREIRDQCVGAGVAFHFKQWGGVFKKRGGRELDGRTWDEMPNLSMQTAGAT
ncbi:MAG: phage Gp37/Gp68 family protein [Chloroflexota bacterium]|nr:phage Gp37/Gp68 family protein [Chloroflexota bacterium]